MQATLVRTAVLEPTRVVIVDLSVSPPAERGTGRIDIVEEWGIQSFPASDPPANW
jgi:uncharacterized protein (UPF0210 family)